MLSLLSDESVHGAVIRGLRRRRPELDLVRAQEAGLSNTPDPVVLEAAATRGRIVLTQDINTMVGYAYDRVRAGLPMPGAVRVAPRLHDRPVDRCSSLLGLAMPAGRMERPGCIPAAMT